MGKSRENLKYRKALKTRQSLQKQDYYRLSDKLPENLLFLTVLEAAALSFIMSYIFYHSLLPGIAAIPVMLPFYLKRGRKKYLRKKKALMREQFQEMIQILSSCLLAGYSVENAMASAYRQMSENEDSRQDDMTNMLGYMLEEIRMGENVQQVWLHFSQSSQIEEIQDFGQIFALSKQSGAPLPKVLKQVSGQLDDKLRTQMQIEAGIAGKQAEQRVMNLVPAGILVYICLTSPEMMEVMYTTVLGRVIMTVGLGIYIFAFALAQRMLEKLYE